MTILNQMTIADYVQAVSTKSISVEETITSCLERIADTSGEGSRAFLKVYQDEALEQARALDQKDLQKSTMPLAGVPVSVKDLIDLEGKETRAGSKVYSRKSPIDAPAMQRLRRSGAIFIGQTNMSELAYSGLGLNPHFGNPLSPYQRFKGHIAGGSSSGAAVSVSDQMAMIGIGTDTGGSCRIPAAFCGVVGWRPTPSRITMQGVMPLSQSCDSLGSLGNYLADCALVDNVMANNSISKLVPSEPQSTKIGLLASVAMDDLEPDIAKCFMRAVEILRKADITLDIVHIPQLMRLGQLTQKGGIIAYEAAKNHMDMINEHGFQMDQRIVQRIQQGHEITSTHYEYLKETRAKLILEVNSIMNTYDALAMPTVPFAPPKTNDLYSDDDFKTYNLRVIQNTSLANILDCPSLSLPCQRDHEPPAGFMLMGRTGQDQNLVKTGLLVENILRDGLK